MRVVLQVVAQALSQALLSQSGCVGLTNGMYAVLFMVQPDELDENGVIVRVSRGFRAERRSPGGPTHALAALSRHAIDTVRKNEMLPGVVRECALRVGNARTECYFDDRLPGGCRRPVARLGVDGGVSDTDKWLREVMGKHYGVIGLGSSGVVLESSWNGKRVAAKLWNERDLDGLRDLLDEIRMYRILQEDDMGVLGVCVPRLVMSRDEPETEAVLVTELVGKSLRRGDEGILLMGEGEEWEAVELWEEENIITAAKKSLRRLHESGILHGDVCMENVRVARRRRFGGWTWRVWWIDLGQAELAVEVGGSEWGDDEIGLFQLEMKRVDEILNLDG